MEEALRKSFSAGKWEWYKDPTGHFVLYQFSLKPGLFVFQLLAAATCAILKAAIWCVAWWQPVL